MNEITRHDSHSIVYTSADASKVSAILGNGQFSCRLLNTNKGGTHAVKIVPAKVLIPNVFSNVESATGTVTILSEHEFDASRTRQEETGILETGFYTIDYLLRRISSICTGGEIVLTFNVDTQRVNTENNTTSIFSILMSTAVATRLGFTTFLPGVNGVVNVLISPGSSSASSTPYMGTTPVVHVLTKRLANANLLSSNNNEYNVVATVDMTGTPYGGYAVFNSFDIYLNDIDFRTPRTVTDIDFEVVDQEFKPLVIDPRFHVVVHLKVYHVDTRK